MWCVVFVVFVVCVSVFVLNLFSKLLASLPDLNLRIVSLLFFVLNKVAQHSDVNKMDSKNLAIVFAPGLLRPEGESNKSNACFWC